MCVYAVHCCTCIGCSFWLQLRARLTLLFPPPHSYFSPLLALFQFHPLSTPSFNSSLQPSPLILLTLPILRFELSRCLLQLSLPPLLMASKPLQMTTFAVSPLPPVRDLPKQSTLFSTPKLVLLSMDCSPKHARECWISTLFVGVLTLMNSLEHMMN